MIPQPVFEERRRSLRDDLLDDLLRGTTRSPAPVVTPPQPRAPSVPTLETPAVEVRITPRAWASAGWTLLPGGDGFVISLGPIRLSLGRLRP